MLSSNNPYLTKQEEEFILKDRLMDIKSPTNIDPYEIRIDGKLFITSKCKTIWNKKRFASSALRNSLIDKFISVARGRGGTYTDGEILYTQWKSDMIKSGRLEFKRVKL